MKERPTPQMRQYSSLIGHTAQREAFSRLLAQGKLPPTLLFSGREGIGKKLVAQWLGASLLCQHRTTTSPITSPCGVCAHCRKSIACTHPDFIEVSCNERDEGSTEKIRDILKELSLCAFSGGSRIVLFDHAESLHESAANALLKTLEEPRPGTHFILITSSPSQILSTIRSRSQQWYFAPLTQKEMLTYIREFAPESSEEVISLAEGAPGMLSRFQLLIPEWNTLQDTLSRILRGDIASAHALATLLGKDKDYLAQKLAMIRTYIRMRLKRTPEDPTWSIGLANTIEAERLILERHLQPTPVLLAMLLSLSPEIGASTGELLRDVAL